MRGVITVKVAMSATTTAAAVTDIERAAIRNGRSRRANAVLPLLERAEDNCLELRNKHPVARIAPLTAISRPYAIAPFGGRNIGPAVPVLHCAAATALPTGSESARATTTITLHSAAATVEMAGLAVRRDTRSIAIEESPRLTNSALDGPGPTSTGTCGRLGATSPQGRNRLAARSPAADTARQATSRRSLVM